MTFKKIKKISMILLILIIIAGGLYLLLYMNIIKAPSFLQSIPFLNNKISTASSDKQETELEKITKENDKLHRSLTANNKEIDKLKKQIK
ncbi:MAG: hypothetical protein ABFC94_12025, partial [Syntrophomonas sp.]